jgi:hypothetical protein
MAAMTSIAFQLMSSGPPLWYKLLTFWVLLVAPRVLVRGLRCPLFLRASSARHELPSVNGHAGDRHDVR